MLRFAAEENFNADILRGLLRRKPDLDIVRVQDVGLSGADDRAGLEWAAGVVSWLQPPFSQADAGYIVA